MFRKNEFSYLLQEERMQARVLQRPKNLLCNSQNVFYQNACKFLECRLSVKLLILTTAIKLRSAGYLSSFVGAKQFTY